MTTSHHLSLLSGAEIRDHLDPLTAVLEDCVNGGASVSFLLPFHPETARAFWRDVADSVDASERLLLVAESRGNPAFCADAGRRDERNLGVLGG